MNATMARTFFHDENPLGKRLQLGALPDQEVPTMEIVGVVGDVHFGLGTDPQAEMYLPYRQADSILPVFQLSLVMRTAGDPSLETSALRSALAEIDPNQPLVKVRTMEEKHGHHGGAAPFSYMAHRNPCHARSGTRGGRRLRRDVLYRDATHR